MTDEHGTKIPDDVASLLHRVSRDWVPYAIPTRLLASVKWGDRDLSVAGRTLFVEGEQLGLTIALPETAIQGTLERMPFGDLTNRSIEGRTEDGCLFAARAGFIEAVRSQLRPGSRGEIGDVRGLDWTIHQPERPARLWVAEVEGELPPGLVNMTMDYRGALGGSISHRHLCLRGAKYAYYFIRARRGDAERVLLCVDLGTETVPEPLLLHEELGLISFSLSRPIFVRLLFGLDASARNVAAVGGGFGVQPARRVHSDSLVPSRVGAPAWPASLFTRLAQHAASLPVAKRADLRLATWYYLDALSDTSADGFQLKTYLALAAAA